GRSGGSRSNPAGCGFASDALVLAGRMTSSSNASEIPHAVCSGYSHETLLESAVAAPQPTMMGQPLMSDPIEIAAAYLFYICRNHPFVDGNKRTALAACLAFLEGNDLLPSVKLAMEEWENFVLDLAASKLDRDATTQRPRKLLKRSRKR